MLVMRRDEMLVTCSDKMLITAEVGAYGKIGAHFCVIEEQSDDNLNDHGMLGAWTVKSCQR